MLEVNQINVFHGDLQALWGVSLSIQSGELVALIGSNGAGKTTTVESIAGLNKLSAGQIKFNGVEINALPTHEIVRMGISLVPENKGIFTEMSILENLELGAFLPENRRQRNETLDFVYQLFPILEKRKDQMAGTLSGGEQQMVAIARALMSRPKLLIFDEPSLGLAPLIVKSIFKIIRQIKESGVSILLVEQNVKAALELAQHAFILENGHVIRHGEAQTILNDPVVQQAYLGMH